jgi:hypothetical protein
MKKILNAFALSFLTSSDLTFYPHPLVALSSVGVKNRRPLKVVESPYQYWIEWCRKKYLCYKSTSFIINGLKRRGFSQKLKIDKTGQMPYIQRLHRAGKLLKEHAEWASGERV